MLTKQGECHKIVLHEQDDVRRISIFYLEPPVMVKTTTLDSGDEELEDVPFPTAVQKFLLRTPRLEFFVRGETLCEVLFDLASYQIFETPVRGIADVRRKIIMYLAPDDDELSPATGVLSEANIVFTDECIRFLLEPPVGVKLCGCGLHTLKEDKRCESCGAVLCPTCSGFKFCSGCFALIEAEKDEEEVEWP